MRAKRYAVRVDRPNGHKWLGSTGDPLEPVGLKDEVWLTDTFKKREDAELWLDAAEVEMGEAWGEPEIVPVDVYDLLRARLVELQSEEFAIEAEMRGDEA